MKAMTKKYYFSVEGKTEKWYLDWLQNAINTANTATYKVVFDSKVEKNITYKLGYSNFTFELWMILHKQDCNTCFDNRK